MIKLTPENYYNKDNRALTTSKIKDYTLCPNYFYRKHIICEIEDKPNDNWLVGGAVDKLVSGEKFEKKHIIVPKRTEKLKEQAKQDGVVLMLQSHLDQIIELADSIEKTDAWKTIKENANFQTILQVPMKINDHFDGLAGKPDFWWIDNSGMCYLIDLKTAAFASHKKYYYDALKFHYDWQLADYKYLLSITHPEISSFRYFHLVADKVKDIYNVELFEWPEEIIDIATREVINVIQAIANDKEYKKYNPSFDKPVMLGDIKDEWWKEYDL